MNNYRSLSLAFRVGLAFHGLNMEGASGNVMEPRRIALGDAEYDGISGEIVRRHILENFVSLAIEQGLPIHSGCRGLIPERGKGALSEWMQSSNEVEQAAARRESGGEASDEGESAPQRRRGAGAEGRKHLNPLGKTPAFSPATAQLLSGCSICDIGGYLIAYERTDPVAGTLKRDSTFEVGWLISEHPTQTDYTQHAAYKPDQNHNLFTMGIRSAIYGGVMRFDLDRIGHNDWWWLQRDGTPQRWPVAEEQRRDRARTLLKAARQWLLSLSGARQAGWLQHQGEPFEGVLVLSQDGPAPFISPIGLGVENSKPCVKPNGNYREAVKRLAEQKGAGLTSYEFNNQAELMEKFEDIYKELGFDRTK